MDDDLRQRIFERVRDTLEEMHQRAEDLKGKHQVPADDVFTPAFMSEHTSFDTLAAFLAAGDFDMGEEEILEGADSEGALDRHARETTSFDGWDEMREAAEEAWFLDRLRGDEGSASSENG